MQTSTIAKIAVTAAVAVAGVTFFVKSTLGHTKHFKDVDQLGELSQWTDKDLLVRGHVIAGSIREVVVDQETQRSFLLTHGGKTLRVFHVGPKPDTFKDESEVVADGRIVPAAERRRLARSLEVALDVAQPYVFEATELKAKCPSRYQGAPTNKAPAPDYTRLDR